MIYSHKWPKTRKNKFNEYFSWFFHRFFHLFTEKFKARLHSFALALNRLSKRIPDFDAWQRLFGNWDNIMQLTQWIISLFKKFRKFLVSLSFIFSSLTKPNASVFRPRSSRCSTESRKMSLKHQHSIDFSNDLPSENLLGKRSDSLQSLNSVDNQKSNSKERKTNFKPIKIAWASRAPSEEKNFKTAFENWKTDDTCEHTEPFMDCKNRLEESKKKSIDIFLSRNFIEPTDILPSPNRPKLSLLKSFGTSFTKHEPEKCPDLPIIEDDKKEEIEPDNKSEKKVTFAADLNKKTNAETRRMNFRNSYSKRYTTNFSFSSPRLETQTSIGKCPTPKVEPTNAIKRGNSLTLAENTEELRNLACTSPCFKQPIQTDKMKQFAVKRKLKSCRSRSFHKSLDSSSVIENFDTFSFRKPLKSQNAEVVTMVSLIVSNEDHDSDETTKARNETPRNTKETFKENDPEKQTKTGK